MLPRKDLFHIPEGVIYLDGNSLGLLPIGAAERAHHVITKEWGDELIRAWNTSGWMALPQLVGDRIAGFIGAPSGSVATGDTLSIKVYQALDAALKLRPDRKVILSDTDNFPTDLYMAEGLIKTISRDYELRTCTHDAMHDAIDESVAAVLLTHVDYRTGRRYDMASITQSAQAAGAIMIWDLAHSTGAMPIDMNASGAEFAVGCTYKYLNGGPGSPAFIYVRPDLIESIDPALAGWLGHDAPFAMEKSYRPAKSIERLRVGTPSIVQLSILDAALNVWVNVSLDEVRDASINLSELFINEVEKRCPELQLASPRNPQDRGSQVSFTFENGYAAIKALIDLGVIGDYRAPHIMRFGFTPLYLDDADILTAVHKLEEVMKDKLWDKPEYKIMSRVT